MKNLLGKEKIKWPQRQIKNTTLPVRKNSEQSEKSSKIGNFIRIESQVQNLK